MIYTIEYAEEAYKDLLFFKKSGNKSLLKKIATLLKELQEHPFEGTGKPELLKHQLQGCYSRRINREHRLVYQVDNDENIVTVLSVKGHY